MYAALVAQNREELKINPTKKIKWIAGLKAAFAIFNAKQRSMYSWVAKSDECYIYTAEIDHLDKENNIYEHTDGVFIKYVSALSKENGDSALNISLGQELFDAATDSYNTSLKCRLLLVKGTKFGQTEGGTKAAADGDYWQITKLSGSVATGFGFTLERIG